jgi:hypothetical protein
MATSIADFAKSTFCGGSDTMWYCSGNSRLGRRPGYVRATAPLHDRQGAERGTDLRRRPGGEQLRLCRSHREPGVGKLYRLPHPHPPVSLEGAPRLVIPDSTRIGVNRACRYELDLNCTNHELVIYYGVGVLLARTYNPAIRHNRYG